MRTPRSVDLELTSTCNLRCRYCYFFGNDAIQYSDLPTREWLSFIDELGSLGVMNLALAGGEPFMRADLAELLAGIVRNRMRFSLLSNGGLIDDGIAAFIAMTGRCDYVQISVDGSQPGPHDSARGVGSWDGAMRGIQTLQRHGIKVAVRVTIHRHNVDDLEAIARLLLEELGLPSFGTNSAGYLGTCQRHSDELLLTTEERVRAMETLRSLSRRYPGRIQAAAGPLAEDTMWASMESLRVVGSPATEKGGRLTACGCTFSKIAVRPDGVIVPCSILAHLELGRINRDSLGTVWRESPVLAALRSRSDIPLSQFEFCTGCPWQSYCTGNCPGLAYSLTGLVDHPSPDACLKRFLEAGGSLCRDCP
jgi:SynChlorMet cassette radical SAM/SPASM protein ScmE